MDYLRIYREFIEDRKIKAQTLTGYVEKHHIQPRCLGGTNEPDNLVRLTAGDHFFAHLLLARAYGGRQWYALNMLVRAQLIGERKADRAFVIRARRHYDSIRAGFAEEHSARMKGVFKGKAHPMYGKPCSPIALEKLNARIAAGFRASDSPEARAKIGAAHRGKVLSAETRAKLSAHRTGVKLSDEVRANMSAGHKGKKINPETVAKIAAANRGKKRTPEQVAAMRARLTGRKLSPEHRAKLRGRKPVGMKGMTHTPETKAKMSAINQARREYVARFGGNFRTLTVATMREAGIAI